MEKSIIHFTKMQGIGNDYIYINCFNQELKYDPSELAKRISDRHFGVGSDGLVLITPSEKADIGMRIFNPDGSEAEMCGNAIRCVGKYAYERNLIKKVNITVETLAGIKLLDLSIVNDIVTSVKVDMGEPILEPEKIPVITEQEKYISQPFEYENNIYLLTSVSMGNPHAVVFIDNLNKIQIEKIGPTIERAPIFPKRTNVEFVKVIDRNQINMRVWERGAGETLACGTGACAAVVAGVLNNLTDHKVKVTLPGGELLIEWNKEDNHVYMSGPAEFVFDGMFYYITN